MNSTDTVSGVERVSVNESRAGYDPDGRRYWTRTLVCHGGGKTHTLCLHAEAEDALRLRFHPGDLDACLAGLSDAQLDDLIAAARTERMSRDPEPEAAPGCEPDGVCGQCGEPALNGVCAYPGCPTRGRQPAADISDAERNGYGCAATGCGQAVEFGSDWCRDHIPAAQTPAPGLPF